MGSAGTGGATHVSGELFQMMAGIKMLHVPYRGSPPALSDLLAGRVQVMFDNVAASIALIRGGKLRPLAVSSRTDALPGVPPISDFLPGYEAYVWKGVVAPKDCPAEIADKLNGSINAIVAMRHSSPRSTIWATPRCPIRLPRSARSSPPTRKSGRKSYSLLVLSRSNRQSNNQRASFAHSACR
jgi:Tripartite tricarboxylate transporter family receptor